MMFDVVVVLFAVAVAGFPAATAFDNNSMMFASASTPAFVMSRHQQQAHSDGRRRDDSTRPLLQQGRRNQQQPLNRRSLLARCMIPSDLVETAASSVASSSNLVLATIDSDIANIPDNEFAPVFFGGILVMLGGLLSAVFVGTVVDKKNLYASIVADSYAQTDKDDLENDEEFWKGLSEEEKIKTQELLRKIQQQDIGDDGRSAAKEEEEEDGKEAMASDAAVVADNKKKNPMADMFSDY